MSGYFTLSISLWLSLNPSLTDDDAVKNITIYKTVLFTFTIFFFFKGGKPHFTLLRPPSWACAKN